MALTIPDVIEKLGGTFYVAAWAGVTTEAVRQWGVRGSIPAAYWPLLLDRALALGVPLSAEDLVSIVRSRQ